MERSQLVLPTTVNSWAPVKSHSQVDRVLPKSPGRGVAAPERVEQRRGEVSGTELRCLETIYLISVTTLSKHYYLHFAIKESKVREAHVNYLL